MSKVQIDKYDLFVGAIALIGLVLFLVFGGLAGNQVSERLMVLYPLILACACSLFLAGTVLVAPLVWQDTAAVRRWFGPLLLVIMIWGSFAAAKIAPRAHSIFYDEDIYLMVAQNIADTGSAAMVNHGDIREGQVVPLREEYNKEPNGWPFLLAIPFKLFGVSETIAYNLNNLFFVMGIATVALITFYLTNSGVTALFSALIYALIPDNIRWFASVSAEGAAALFAGLALLGAIIYQRHPNYKTGIFFAAACALGCQMRPESGMIVAACLVFLALSCSSVDDFFSPLNLQVAVLFGCLVTIYAVHIVATSHQSWGSSGPKFSLSYLVDNLAVNGGYFLRNTRWPAIFTPFIVMGIFTKQSRFPQPGKMAVITWFGLFFSIFLVFYAGSYNYGEDVRFSILSHMPAAILGGIGMAAFGPWALPLLGNGFRFTNWVGALWRVTLLVLGFVMTYKYAAAIPEGPWAAKADHEQALKFAAMVPGDGIVLTHNPNIFLIHQQSAAQASLATEQSEYFEREILPKYPGGVFFHWNYWCNTNNKTQTAFCDNILESYEWEEFVQERVRSKRFALYRYLGEKE